MSMLLTAFWAPTKTLKLPSMALAVTPTTSCSLAQTSSSSAEKDCATAP